MSDPVVWNGSEASQESTVNCLCSPTGAGVEDWLWVHHLQTQSRKGCCYCDSRGLEGSSEKSQTPTHVFYIYSTNFQGLITSRISLTSVRFSSLPRVDSASTKVTRQISRRSIFQLPAKLPTGVKDPGRNDP